MKCSNHFRGLRRFQADVREASQVSVFNSNVVGLESYRLDMSQNISMLPLVMQAI